MTASPTTAEVLPTPPPPRRSGWRRRPGRPTPAELVDSAVGARRSRTIGWVRAAVATFAVAMLVFLVFPLEAGLSDPRWWVATGTVVVVIIFGAAHVGIVWCALQRRAVRWQRGLVGVELVLTACLPLIWGLPWLGLGAFLIGAVGIAVPWKVAAAAVPVVVVGDVVVAIAVGLPASQLWTLVLQNVFTGFCLGSCVRVGTLAIELYDARSEVARMAVDNERLRFARDLHDVLGHSLSVIALKSELAGRLVPVRPEAAAAELEIIRTVAAGSLKDVRAVAKGYREMDMTRELAGLRAVLTAAGIRCSEQISEAPFPPPVAELFGWALREAVTNVLRHAQASEVVLLCDQANGQALLQVRNDGSRAETRTDPEGGSGLPGLAERVAALGGQMDAGLQPHGWFALTVVLPLDGP